MQIYTMIAYHSRWLDWDFDKHVACEWCEYQYNNYKAFPDWPKQRREIRTACDIDHILWRWWGVWRNYHNRMYDPKNLIFLCRECHQKKWWKKMIRKFLFIVSKKLKYVTFDQCFNSSEAIKHKCLSKG